MKQHHGKVCFAACLALALTACSADQSQQNAAFDTLIEPAAAPPGYYVDDLKTAAAFPPDPQPGHCYARVLLPATYDVSEEKVLVKPEGRQLMEVPAKYRTVKERILDKPAHTVWKRGRGPIDNALKTTYDESTGEVMCLVEVPATYKTIEKRTLITPATTKEMITPAKYKTVSKKRLKTPATTRKVTIPAEYETVRVQKLVEPARERSVDVPASYETVSKRAKLTDEKLAWREVLCDVNMTADVVRSIQTKLSRSGHYGGRIDGLFGPKTIRAVNTYAKAKKLPLGTSYIAVETAEALGVES